jgi:hypothetical protein
LTYGAALGIVECGEAGGMGTLIQLQPFISARRRTAQDPASMFLARIRTAYVSGMELVMNLGVIGFVPKGSERAPKHNLTMVELGALHELIRTGRILRRSERGFAFARYELIF